MEHKKIFNIVFLTVSQIFGAFFMTIVPALSSILQRELSISQSGIGILVSFIFIGSGVSHLVTGKIADHISLGKSFALGSFSRGLCLVFAGFSLEYEQLLLFLSLGGFGGSLIEVASVKGVALWFSEERRATINSIYKVGFPLGSAVAALVLPLLAISFSWQLAFQLLGVFSMVWGFMAFFIDDQKSFYEKNTSSLPSAGRSVLPKAAKVRIYLMGAIGLIFTAIQFSVASYLISYLHDFKYFSLTFSAFFLSLYQFSGMLGRVGLGLCSDYLIKNRLRTLFLVTMVPPVGILLLRGVNGSFLVYVSSILLGFSVVGQVPIRLTLISELVPWHYTGWAAGVAMAVGSIGGIVAPPLVGYVIDMGGSFQPAFTFLFFMSVLGLILTTLLLIHCTKDRPPMLHGSTK